MTSDPAVTLLSFPRMQQCPESAALLTGGLWSCCVRGERKQKKDIKKVKMYVIFTLNTFERKI